MQAQSANLRVTATRPFRIPQHDDQKQLTGVKVIKPGESLTVDRFLAGELISSGKAVLVANDPAPAAFRSNRPDRKE